MTDVSWRRTKYENGARKENKDGVRTRFRGDPGTQAVLTGSCNLGDVRIGLCFGGNQKRQAGQTVSHRLAARFCNCRFRTSFLIVPEMKAFQSGAGSKNNNAQKIL